MKFGIKNLYKIHPITLERTSLTLTNYLFHWMILFSINLLFIIISSLIITLIFIWLNFLLLAYYLFWVEIISITQLFILISSYLSFSQFLYSYLNYYFPSGSCSTLSPPFLFPSPRFLFPSSIIYMFYLFNSFYFLVLFAHKWFYIL